MKSIVLHARALAPTLADSFVDYAQARSVFIDLARVRSPQDKARVENQVPFVREHWFDGEHFTFALEPMSKEERRDRLRH
jgi:hypothetical protein